MARVPYLGPEQVAEEYRSLLARPANLFKALGNSPEGLRSFGRLGGFIRNDSTLDPRRREMAIYLVRLRRNGWAASPRELRCQSDPLVRRRPRRDRCTRGTA